MQESLIAGAVIAAVLIYLGILLRRAKPPSAEEVAADPTPEAGEPSAQAQIEPEPVGEPVEERGDAVAMLTAAGEHVDASESELREAASRVDNPILAIALDLEQQGKFAEATEAYESMLLDDPSDLIALEALARLYEQLEEWVKLQRTLYMMVDSVDDDQRQLELILRTAAIAEEYLDDQGAASARYEMLLELDPDHRLAQERLAALQR